MAWQIFSISRMFSVYFTVTEAENIVLIQKFVMQRFQCVFFTFVQNGELLTSLKLFQIYPEDFYYHDEEISGDNEDDDDDDEEDEQGNRNDFYCVMCLHRV